MNSDTKIELYTIHNTQNMNEFVLIRKDQFKEGLIFLDYVNMGGKVLTLDTSAPLVQNPYTQQQD
jgi:hypothetical protein